MPGGIADSRGIAGTGDEHTRRVRKVPLSNPGRRKEVLGTVVALVSEVGYERLTMDLVAQRARASKATLYQRWPSKAQLVVDALQEHRPVVVDHDTGSFREDMRRLLMSWQAAWTEQDRGLAIAILEGSRTDKDLAGCAMNGSGARCGRPLRRRSRGRASAGRSPNASMRNCCWSCRSRC